MENTNEDNSKKDLRVYVYPRIIAAVLATVVVLWGCTKAMDFFTGSPDAKSQYQQTLEKYPALNKATVMVASALETKHEPAPAKSSKTEHPVDTQASKEAHRAESGLKIPAPHAATPVSPKVDAVVPKAADPKSGDEAPAVLVQPMILGNAFVSALIEPMNYELNERFLGWRPNDVFTLSTDNIKNLQIGVLEVTRRTAEKLVERIARTGSTITFDKDLDLARTKFMNNPEGYIMPSAESAYGQGIKALQRYQKRLNAGKGTFHSRADNLLPLLAAFNELLGDCDENLVKRTENNGDIVSTFKADDYFYYTKGVAKAMGPILEAIMIDFGPILESRGATADLHHSVQMLKNVTELSPLFVQESKLNGFFANHRANMATAISHARSYLQYVIKTITT